MSGDYACRVCEATEDLEILFKKENEALIDMLKLILDVPVEPNDNLPQCLCANCIQRLHQAYKFKLKFLTTDQRLRSTLPFKPELTRNQGSENSFVEDIPIKDEYADLASQKTDGLVSEIIVKEEVILEAEDTNRNVNQPQNVYCESMDELPSKLKRRPPSSNTSLESDDTNDESNCDKKNQVTANKSIKTKRARMK